MEDQTTAQMLSELIFGTVIPLVIVPLLVWATKRGLAYLDAKTKFLDEKVSAETKRNVQTELLDAVTVAVQATSQTYVDAIKKARADGKLTDVEKKEARAQAKARAVAILKERGLSIGEALLDATVEAVVGAGKNSQGDES